MNRKTCSASAFTRHNRFLWAIRCGPGTPVSLGAVVPPLSCVFLLTDLADEGVEGRSEKQPEAGHADHSEQHGRSQRLAHLRAGTRRHGKRRDAKDKGEGRHQDGT
jgi:hypothetical protein